VWSLAARKRFWTFRWLSTTAPFRPAGQIGQSEVKEVGELLVKPQCTATIDKGWREVADSVLEWLNERSL
jgi:hypothetical protein